MTLTVDALKMARHCADISDSVLKLDDLRRQWLPNLKDVLDAEISRSRSENDTTREQLNMTDLIGTAEAAAILGCSQRRVQQIAGDLDGVKIDGRYVFRRGTVTAYKEAMTKP